jgi:hypothetical protein
VGGGPLPVIGGCGIRRTTPGETLLGERDGAPATYPVRNPGRSGGSYPVWQDKRAEGNAPYGRDMPSLKSTADQ